MHAFSPRMHAIYWKLTLLTIVSGFAQEIGRNNMPEIVVPHEIRIPRNAQPPQIDEDAFMRIVLEALIRHRRQQHGEANAPAEPQPPPAPREALRGQGRDILTRLESIAARLFIIIILFLLNGIMLRFALFSTAGLFRAFS